MGWDVEVVGLFNGRDHCGVRSADAFAAFAFERSVCKLPAPAHSLSTGPTSQPASKRPYVTMSKTSSVDADSPTKMECLELFRALKNKDELSRSCKEIMQMITANDKGVMENEPLNTHGGSRMRGGISHAALQRRFTGKMSGVSLSG